MRKLLLSFAAQALFVTALHAEKPNFAPAVAPLHGKGRYAGSHPLAARPGAGFCYIDVPHVHDFLPDQPTLYQQVGDAYVFTGDPVPFGYDGYKTVFYGHHPVPIYSESTATAAPSTTFCFMKGPHYHEYAAPEGPGYKTQNNVIFYIGPIPKDATRIRSQVEPALEAAYEPYVAERPKVTALPPPEWPGTVWIPPPTPALLVSSAAKQSPDAVVTAAPAAAEVLVAPIAPTVVVTPPTPVLIVPPNQAVIVGAPQPGVIHPHGHVGGVKHGGSVKHVGGWKHGGGMKRGGWKSKGHWKH